MLRVLLWLFVFSPFIAGAGMMAEAVWFRMNAVPVMGTFESTTRAYEKSWYANFSYTDAAGVEQSARTSTSSSFHNFDPHQQVALVVRPAQPDRVRLASHLRYWNLPLAIFLPGLAIAGVALFLRRRA